MNSTRTPTPTRRSALPLDPAEALEPCAVEVPDELAVESPPVALEPFVLELEADPEPVLEVPVPLDEAVEP